MTSGIRLLIQLVESFFSTWALMKASRMEPGNVLTLIFFLLCFLFYHYQNKYSSQITPDSMKCIRKTAGGISVIFTLLYMFVDYSLYIQNLSSTLFRIGILSSVFIGFFFLFYKLLILLFGITGKLSVTDSSMNPSVLAKLAFYQKHTGLAAFILCMLCWLPYFLYQYPGIMTPDSINQFEQVLGVIPYSNHHPVLHTLLFKLLYTIGYQITGNMVMAVSLYTLFQMIALTLAAGYLVNTMALFHVRLRICFAVTLFYALIPYHAVYSVTIWKDILFAAALLFFCCSMLRIKEKRNLRDLCVLTISGFVLCLFRSNGWYGMLLCLPFLFYSFRRQKKTVYPAFIIIFLSAAIIRYPVMNACHVTQPDLIESLSIPTQQIAAVISNNRELTAQQLELINNVVDISYVDDLYVPYFADNMKELVRAGHEDYLVSHKKEFFKLWVQLGLAYPGDYLTAYINQTYGYWYPDSFYPVADGEGVSATELGVSHTPLIGGPLVVKAKEISIKLGGILPIYGTIWSMGVGFWILLICIGIVITRHEKDKLILYLPGAALFATVIIATPVATDFRYVYFLMFALPFYIVVSMLPVSKTKEI